MGIYTRNEIIPYLRENNNFIKLRKDGKTAIHLICSDSIFGTKLYLDAGADCKISDNIEIILRNLIFTMEYLIVWKYVFNNFIGKGNYDLSVEILIKFYSFININLHNYLGNSILIGLFTNQNF